MKPDKFKFSGGLWKYNGSWRITLDINDLRDTFMMDIKNKVITWHIFDKESSYTKERLGNVLEQCLLNPNVQDEIACIKEIICNYERTIKLLEKDTLVVRLASYESDGETETIVFQINEEQLEFYLNYTHEIDYSFAYLPGKLNGIYIENIKEHFPSWLLMEINRQIGNHPKVRVKRIFKK